MIEGKYQIIYADPPWQFNFRNRKGLSNQAKANLYDTMSDEDIKSLPINSLASENCALFLWVMNSKLNLGLECMSKWGFDYKTIAFTWVKWAKNTYHFGGGNWTRSNPEICLLGVKGKMKRQSASVRNLLVSPVREHSRKPDEVRDSIVQLMGDLPRVELFARQTVPGWGAWGNQTDFYDTEDDKIK
jgi:N6-adenosine-specific RNA methylase IME4